MISNDNYNEWVSWVTQLSTTTRSSSGSRCSSSKMLTASKEKKQMNGRESCEQEFRSKIQWMKIMMMKMRGKREREEHEEDSLVDLDI